MQPDLSEKRFSPTPDTLAIMKSFKSMLPDLQIRYPQLQIQGFGFFGSRVIGKERPDTNNPSDQDLTIFYDESKLRAQLIEGKLHETDKEEMLDTLRGKIASAMRTLGLPVDEGSEPGKFRTIGMLDISESVTNGTIAAFRFSVDNHPDFNEHPELLDPFALGLTSRFFLGIGEGLYRNREHILKKFEEMGANGERCFQALMSYLQYTERTKPAEKRAVSQYQHYPQTIAEARQYFVIG